MARSSTPPWHALVSPSDNGVAGDIRRALRGLKEARLFPDANDGVATTKSTISDLKNAVDQHRIDAIFPTSDESVMALTARRDDLTAKILAPSLEVCRACYAFADAHPQDATVIVDCFSQTQNGIRVAQAREILPDGMQRLIHLPEAKIIAAELMTALGVTGAWAFYARRDADGALRPTRVLPRLAEGFTLTHMAGPNLPLLSLYDAVGYDLTVDVMPTKARMRYGAAPQIFYDEPIGALYVDLDGSLILHDAVNSRLVQLIRQSRARGIPVYLLTRHPHDLNATLARYGLHPLFDRIIHATDIKVPKAHYIAESDALLIDDSFRERHETYALRGVRCLDPAAACGLIDDEAQG